MERWYQEYYSQNWYKNTFLVRRPEQIGQAINSDEIEWNNIHDSGCNFTCLAMIIGVDPARLSSELSSYSYHFFFADSELRAQYLIGKKGGLVWDQNEPYKKVPKVVIKNFWHTKLGRRTKITISFKGEIKTKDVTEGKRFIVAARKDGLHVICGPDNHSHLVAGKIDNEFYIWDPDDSEKPVEKYLKGQVRLNHIFENDIDEPIEFWKYRVDFT
ncbi:MAG: hypothetical protein U9Q84_04115 [Thermodesulfobacteriota bacterium]|nr:hypothetical protein [Thermodesulfobacteriota bacterium]